MHPPQELGGPGLQPGDLANYDGGRVWIDFVDRRLLADVGTAAEFGADQRPHSVAVAARLACSLRDPKIDIVFGKHVAAQFAQDRALLSGTSLRRAEHDAGEGSSVRKDQVTPQRHLLVAPAKEFEVVPIEGVEVLREVEFGGLRAARIDE